MMTMNCSKHVNVGTQNLLMRMPSVTTIPTDEENQNTMPESLNQRIQSNDSTGNSTSLGRHDSDSSISEIELSSCDCDDCLMDPIEGRKKHLRRKLTRRKRTVRNQWFMSDLGKVVYPISFELFFYKMWDYLYIMHLVL